MAQQQSQYSAPARPFSPPQNSPSGSGQFALPPSKRQRVSPNPPSQPGSPYTTTPYGMSPSGNAPPSSDFFSEVRLPPNIYNTPYQSSPNINNQNNGQTMNGQNMNGQNGQNGQNVNGHSMNGQNQNGYNTNGINSNGQNTPNNLTFPQPPNHNNPPPQNHQNFQNQIQQNHQSNFNFNMTPPGGPGAMGPPSKPPEKIKEDGVDPMDVLGGTGVDLREEEQYSFQLYNTSFSQPSGSQSGTVSSGHSFSQYPPGDEASFFGAGPANAAAERANTKSQDEYLAKAADKAWRDAARNLAVSRQREINDPFLMVPLLQRNLAKVVRDNGIDMKMDSKGHMGQFIVPGTFANEEVRATTAMGPNSNSAYMVTSGPFLPPDTMLADHLALLSIATKYRLRGMVEDATRLAKARQTGSQGIIPEDWADAGVPINVTGSTPVAEGALRGGWESAVGPHSDSVNGSTSFGQKIPAHAAGDTNGSTKVIYEVATALRTQASKERDLEEARLLRRHRRANGDTSTSRQGSIAPGSIGMVAPEAIDKIPTKKEQKKKAEAKVNDAASHAAANSTLNKFSGGGGGLFGKKKKYSWMDPSPAGGGSGASTPGRPSNAGLPGTPGAPVANTASERLTVDHGKKLGVWREDTVKGKDIQLRDWVFVLEEDGRDKKALQKAYANLDSSEPK